MSEAQGPERTSGADESERRSNAGPVSPGMSPYATGGGGVTFERKVAVQYLARLLLGHGASELGDGLRVVSVAFQQAPEHAVDDLVVSAARPDEPDPSLVLAVAVRRSPEFVSSDEATRKLVRAFVDAVLKVPLDGPEHRWCLVVAGSQPHAEQLAELAALAETQMDAPGFFDLVRTPGKFDAGVRGRLDQIEKLVQRALHDIGRADTDKADTVQVQQHAWRLLAGLSVSMPRLEAPDETDWAEVANSLIPVARDSDLAAAAQLRDRLVTLAAEYSPKSARVDLTVLRRDAHDALDPTARRHQQGWQALDHLHHRALASVRGEIKEIDGDRRLRLDRSAAAAALAETVAGAAAVVVAGESGVGKSALALGLPGTDAAGANRVQALCINLRHVHKLTVEFEKTLGCSLATVLCELSAPQRMLIIDGADAVAEGSADALRYLVDAAHASDVNVVAVASVDNKQVVRDTLADRFGADVKEYAVAPLTDPEIDEIVKAFGKLAKLGVDPRSRELLRRLVVVDLLVRGGVSGVPLSDADAMREVWSGLVRRRGMSDRGSPDARESVLLRLAALALDDVDDMERLDAVQALDSAALAGLRQDGLLREPVDDAFGIGPEFGHDEVRRYAVARLLRAGRGPASRITRAGAPRWSLAAARLACQALLAEPDGSANPLRGRFATLQASFDAIVAAGHGTRWGDVPGEAMLRLGNPNPVLRDAWPVLQADDAAGLRRLARLVDQRLCTNGIVDLAAVEPIITLLLEEPAPWARGEYAQRLLRDWLRAHVVVETPAGHPLRTTLCERLIDLSSAARLAGDREPVGTGPAPGTPVQLKEKRRDVESHDGRCAESGHVDPQDRHRPEIPAEVVSDIFLELLALLGPDRGARGAVTLRQVARHAPERLAPAVDDAFASRALAIPGRGLLAELTEAYYLDDRADGTDLLDEGIRERHPGSATVSAVPAWLRGPFMPLFQTDFRNGVAVLNRLLNHAAAVRVRTLAHPDEPDRPLVPSRYIVDSHRPELQITGVARRYVGDQHVWLWYRGTGVGPDPCLNALRALERVCDQLIATGVPIGGLVSMLLDGCENLAMVGLVVGLLVRHLEDADRLLDPYFTEPLVWQHEFTRVVEENNGFAVRSEGVVKPERRTWSLREAALFLVLRARSARVAELRALGDALVANARQHVGLTPVDAPTEAAADVGVSAEARLMWVRAWAATLDRDRCQVRMTPNGQSTMVEVAPSDDVVRALQGNNADLDRIQERMRLIVRYYPRDWSARCRRIEAGAEPAEVIQAELAADVASARELLRHPSSFAPHDLWDAPALVAAAAIEYHIIHHVDLPRDMLSFAGDILLRAAEGEAEPRQDEYEDTVHQQGADRSSARVLPLLLLPAAALLRSNLKGAGGLEVPERVVRASVKLARAVAAEVRLYLARSLDHAWETPCAAEGRCHHDLAFDLATETMRRCLLGPWVPREHQRSVVAVEEPIAEALAKVEDDNIVVRRLDAAMRSLAPAVAAKVCVSAAARSLLMALLRAQRRSLLSRGSRGADHRGTHSLVSARALLTLADGGDDAAIYEHVNAYAEHPALLRVFLRAMSAAAEETPGRAATARRVWPRLVRHVLALCESGHAVLGSQGKEDLTVAALVPNAAGEVDYLYREVHDSPIVWWDPLALRSEVEAWLDVAAGRPACVDQVISFVSAIEPEEQVRMGLPWVARLVLSDPAAVAEASFRLTAWLIERRADAADAGLLAMWQEVVDALVVEGVTRLAPHSE